MNKWYMSLVFLFATPQVLGSIELAKGITLSTLNGEPIDKVEDAALVVGQNQLVLDFTGYLSDSGKREFISTPPYVLVVDVPSDSEVEIDLESRKFGKIESKSDREQPIFEVSINDKIIETQQEILPASEGALPYGDIPLLVKQYNQERGLVFDSGKIRSLKKELADLQVSSEQGAVASKADFSETENSLQLKLWYSRATKEERVEFRKWMIEQE
ncbi:DUF2057 domain-containing protein [Vibrio sp. T187]|uniref:DUF2057 family protein n=1 Tax=Vibrio TaxID=662 RepID=UPI0010C9ED66|nr:MULTISPECIES: DUF2057 family protein [Vibrio]MBW3696594.1 DUF2057 domain-containing protein [Vibrio sp. T187]